MPTPSEMREEIEGYYSYLTKLRAVFASPFVTPTLQAEVQAEIDGCHRIIRAMHHLLPEGEQTKLTNNLLDLAARFDAHNINRLKGSDK